jgi:CIC family chloride channel protein
VIGTLVGAVAVGFQWSLTLAENAREWLLSHLHRTSHSNAWAWMVLPAIGLIVGSLIGWMAKQWAPDAPGSGIPHIKGALINVRQIDWPRLLPVKFAGSVLGIGAGLSLGREGPTVQMGAAIAQAISRVLRVPARTLPQLISAGAGAGLAAAFNAPLAGFLFVIEELHREMSALTFGGALVSAVSATIVSRSLTGQLPSFAVQGFPALPLTALPAVAALGLIGGALGCLFTKVLVTPSFISTRSKRTVVPGWMKPGLAAAACGLLAWWLPDAIGGGHAVAERLLQNHASTSIGALSALLIAKFIMTTISYRSGAPGGIFAPVLLMGTALGLLVASVAPVVYSGMHGSFDAFAVLGMAAVFTGSVRAPLTGIVLILEMTSNYEQLLSLCLVCLVAHIVAETIKSPPIYEALLERDLRTRGIASPDGQLTEPRAVVMGIQRNSALQGKTLREAGLPVGCLVVGVERGGREVLPHADLMLAAGDHISVLVPAHQPQLALVIVDLARAR